MREYEIEFNKTKEDAYKLSRKLKEEQGVPRAGEKCSFETAMEYRRQMELLVEKLIYNDNESPMSRLKKAEALMVTELDKREKLRAKICITREEYRLHDRRIEILTDPLTSIKAALSVLKSKAGLFY